MARRHEGGSRIHPHAEGGVAERSAQVVGLGHTAVVVHRHRTIVGCGLHSIARRRADGGAAAVVDLGRSSPFSGGAQGDAVLPSDPDWRSLGDLTPGPLGVAAHLLAELPAAVEVGQAQDEHEAGAQQAGC